MSEPENRILFLHGFDGSPTGTKWRRLSARFGAENVAAPDLGFGSNSPVVQRSMAVVNFSKTVKIAQNAFDEYRPDIVVASSLGSAVSMRMNLGAAALVLVAPAWKRATIGSAIKGYLKENCSRWSALAPLSTLRLPEVNPNGRPISKILHSPHDKVVPLTDSYELLRLSGSDKGCLEEVGNDHRMNDEWALQAMVNAVRELIATKSSTA